MIYLEEVFRSHTSPPPASAPLPLLISRCGRSNVFGEGYSMPLNPKARSGSNISDALGSCRIQQIVLLTSQSSFYCTLSGTDWSLCRLGDLSNDYNILTSTCRFTCRSVSVLHPLTLVSHILKLSSSNNTKGVCFRTYTDSK